MSSGYRLIDVQHTVTRMHRDPAGDHFGSVSDLRPDDLLTPLLMLELAVRLTDFGFDPVHS